MNSSWLEAYNHCVTKVVVGFNELMAKSFKSQFKVLRVKDDLLFHRGKDRAILGFTNDLFAKRTVCNPKLKRNYL